MKHTARTVALEALLRMEEKDGYSNLVIDRALRGNTLNAKDAALASAIFYGVLEKRLTLDHFLRQCLKEPGKKLEPAVREALRCGVYQILFLDKIPDSAAVNETVNAVKAVGKTSAAGFVNGVLRGLLRKKGSLSLPSGDTDFAWSLRYSVPEELISLWRVAYGTENTKKLLEALEEKPELFVRLNKTRPGFENLSEQLEGRGASLKCLTAPAGAGILKAGGSPTELPEFQKGMFHVQDLSAQLVCEILAPQPGDTIYDCCAAPGGKSFTLAEMLQNSGSVTAFDLYPSRVKLIEEGAKRLGLSNITARTADMTKLPAGLTLADRVLCDVPCSGFGVIRRKPEIRYKKLSAAAELPQLQYEILRNASRLVKPGGTLLYSTCTLNPAENGAVAERFLKENNGFMPKNIDIPAVDGGLRRIMEEPAHHLTMTPFAGASDGFFAAAFQKRQESGEQD